MPLQKLALKPGVNRGGVYQQVRFKAYVALYGTG